MSSLHRAALSVALTVAPMLVTGCAQMPRQTACQPQAATSMAQMGEGKMTLARQEEGRGNFAQAKLLYEDIYRLEPGNVECMHRLGVVCTRLNLHQEADHYLKQAHARTPNDAELLADLGYAAFMRKDYAQSEFLLEQSVKLNGSNPRSINNLAIARAWRGNDEGSLTMFRIVNSEVEAQRRLQAIQLARGDQAPAKAKSAPASDMPPAPSAPEFLARYKTPELSRQNNDFTLPVPVATTSRTSDDVIVPPAPGGTIELTTHTDSVSVGESPIEQPVAEAAVEVEESDELANVFEDENVFDQETVEILAPEPPVSVTVTAEPVLPEAVAADDERQVQIPAEIVSMADVDEVAVSAPDLPAPVVTEPVIAERVGPEPVVTSSQTEAGPVVLTAWRKTPPAHGGAADGRSREWNGGRLQPSQIADAAIFDAKGVCRTCLVTLFEESRILQGEPTYTFEYQSRRYQFSSAEALRKFQATPRRYAPAAGGLDVVAVRNERQAIQGTLKFGLWHCQQLYLFSCRENADAFFREPSKFVAVDD